MFLPGESQGQRSLVGCHLWGRRVGHDWSDLAAAATVMQETSSNAGVVAVQSPTCVRLYDSIDCSTPGVLCSITGFDPRVRKIPWRRKWQPAPVFLGNPLDRGAWWATVHGVGSVGHDLRTNHYNHHHRAFHPAALPKMLAELETQAKIFLGVANDNSAIFLQIQQ